MALPLASLITALPAIIKQLKTKPKSGVKELTAIGVGGAIVLIYQDLLLCGADITTESLSCVTAEHWGALVIAGLALVARLNAKRKEAKDD
jgi:hypothetical protein